MLGPGAFRVFLATMVLISHVSIGRFGVVAVMVFFILSGYWVTRMFRQKYLRAPAPVSTFYLSRFLRLWPAFVAAVFVAIAIKFTIGDPTGLKDIYVLTMLGAASGKDDPLSISWSLDIEMQFYLLLPWMLVLAHRAGTPAMRFMLVCAATLAAWPLSLWRLGHPTAMVWDLTPTGTSPLQMVVMMGFGMVIPILPFYVEQFNAGGSALGLLMAVYALMQFFMSPIIGALSDRYGRRPVILGSLTAYSLDFFLMGVAPTIGFLLVARLLSGAFSATFATANAYIADISPPEKRAANFGLMGAAFGLGFIIGPAIGGLLGDHFGPRAPFYTVAVLGIINLIYGYFFLPETLPKANRRSFEWKRANALGNFLQFRQYPVLLPIAGCIFLYQLGHWSMPSTWVYLAEERFKWTPGDIGYSLMAVGLAAAFVQGGITRFVIPKIGEPAAAVTGLCIAACSYWAYAFASHGWMIYAIIPVGALAGLTLPALQGIMSRTAPSIATSSDLSA